MEVAFVTCDVFTNERFGGNPLAVVLEAGELEDAQMQKIAAEFNYSETTFVQPATVEGYTARVRIFTPRAELAFAGHPNVGTALMLADLGLVTDTEIIFEQMAGPVRIRLSDGEMGRQAVLTAPVAPTVGETVPVAEVAAASGLAEDAIAIDRHAPVRASAGTEFLFVELKDRARLKSLKPSESYADLPCTGVFFYVRTGGQGVSGRMFAPTHGIPEDPATGAAAAALAGLLASLEDGEGNFHWALEQGVDMGRPSRITMGATKHGDDVTAATVGGGAIAVARGMLTVE